MESGGGIEGQNVLGVCILPWLILIPPSKNRIKLIFIYFV